MPPAAPLGVQLAAETRPPDPCRPIIGEVVSEKSVESICVGEAPHLLSDDLGEPSGAVVTRGELLTADFYLSAVNVLVALEISVLEELNGPVSICIRAWVVLRAELATLILFVSIAGTTLGTILKTRRII